MTPFEKAMPTNIETSLRWFAVPNHQRGRGPHHPGLDALGACADDSHLHNVEPTSVPDRCDTATSFAAITLLADKARNSTLGRRIMSITPGFNDLSPEKSVSG
jgi:hypothetical protein